MRKEHVCNRITSLCIDLSTKEGHSHLTLGRWTGQTRYLKLDVDDSVHVCLPRLAGGGRFSLFHHVNRGGENPPQKDEKTAWSMSDIN